MTAGKKPGTSTGNSGGIFQEVGPRGGLRDNFESPRVLRRLNTLRGLSHEENEQVLARGA